MLLAGCASVEASPADGPLMEVLPAADTAAVDGRAAFAPTAPWVPLLAVDWEERRGQANAWFRTEWSDRGLHLAVHMPYTQATDRMPVGRPPDAPFALNLSIEGSEGPYVLRCVPLVDAVESMTRRQQFYLMNFRLGANAENGKRGHVVCQERSQRGILPDSVETRWREASGGGLTFEARLPWSMLRLDEPVADMTIPFSIEINPAGLPAVRWGTAEEPGALCLTTSAASSDAVSALVPQVPSTLVRPPDSVAVAYPKPDTGPLSDSVTFTLVDDAGIQQRQVAGTDAGESLFGRIATEGLDDGTYTLEVRRADRVVGERVLRFAGDEIDSLEARRQQTRQRMEALRTSGNPAWADGHLAHAQRHLDLAQIPERAHPEDLPRARDLVDRAASILDAVEAGRHPPHTRARYDDPAGFVADGARGPVVFEPTNGSNARLTVRPSEEPGWDVSPHIYGTFLEPVLFDRPAYQLLYAQQLRNASFEWGHPSPEETAEHFMELGELAGDAEEVLAGHWIPRIDVSLDEVAAPWFAVGRGPATFEGVEDAYNTERAQRIRAEGGAREVGVAQLISLPAWRAARYQFRGFARSADAVQNAEVRLYHRGDVVDRFPLGAVEADWMAVEGELTTPPLEDERNAFVLAIVFDGPGQLDLDLVTLTPTDAVDGFDPQAVEQLRRLNTGWVRWPGGNFVSGYDWTDGVGPLDERRAHPNPAWRGIVSNFMGTNEFLRLAEQADFEPLITVNAGNGTPEEAAQWVEYVNSDTTTAMGRLRAEHGHPEPYNVTHWNVGNELWGWWQIGHTNPKENARRYQAFARAMRAVDPSIQLIACGAGAHSIADPGTWNRPLLEEVGEALEAIDVHTYVNVPAGVDLTDRERAFLLSAIPISYEQWLIDYRDELLRRGLDHVGIDVGEYNGNPHAEDETMDQAARLLAYAGWLHAFMRQGEYVIGANATEYSAYDPRSAPFDRLHPRFDLHRLYAEQAGTRPVSAYLETPVRQQPEQLGRDVVPTFNLPLVDAVALMNPEDDTLSISLMNRNPSDSIDVEIRLEGWAPGAEGQRFIFEASSNVQQEAVSAGESFTVSLAPYSVSLVVLPSASAP